MKPSSFTIDFKYRPDLAWSCLGFPDDSHKTLIRQDGSLQYGFDRVITFGLRHAPTAPRTQQETEHPGSAIVKTQLDYGFARLDLTSFAARDEQGKRLDIVLWQLRPTFRDKCQTLIGALTIRIDDVDRVQQLKRLPAASADLPLKQPPAIRHPHAGLCLRSIPSPISVCEDYEHIGHAVFQTEAEPLRNGQTLRGAFVVSLEAGARLPQTLKQCESLLKDARAFWKNFAAQKRTLRVPDPAINDMIAACARNILQAREVKNGIPCFQVGPLVYRGLWMVDGLFITEAARFLGWDEDADRAWDLLIKRCQPDGSIIIMPGHTKETGIALATMARITELSGNRDRLKQSWKMVRRAVKYIQSLREQAKKLPRKHLCHGLVPESFGDGGIGGKRPEYTTSLWLLAGLKAAAHMARQINSTDVNAFEQAYQSFRKDFLAHARRHRVAHGKKHRLYMSIAPGQHNFSVYPQDKKGKPQPWTAITPAVATWALCQAIYPGEVFDPDDEIVQDLLDLNNEVDRAEGIPAGTGWLSWNALWNYHAAFAAEVALYADMPQKAAQYLYAMANHAYPTRVWREEQNLSSHPQKRYYGEMPHNWASAEFIRLVRNMLVFETKDQLHVLKGLPSQWLIASHSIEVNRTPTRFGEILLQVDIPNAHTLDIRLTGDNGNREQPKCIRLYRPAKIKRVLLNGVALPLTSAAFIEIDPNSVFSKKAK